MKVRARKGLCLVKPIIEESVSESGIVWQMAPNVVGNRFCKAVVVDADPIFEAKEGDHVLVDKLAMRFVSYKDTDGQEVFALTKANVLAVFEDPEAKLENDLIRYSQKGEDLCQLEIGSSKS